MRMYAIVTGAASGFGIEFSKLLAADSYNLILIDKDEQGLAKAKIELEKKFSVDIDTLTQDLSDPGSADLIFQNVKQYNIRVLINNAGYGLFGFFSQTDWKPEKDMINLHVMTLTRLTKLFLPGMIARRDGMIMNVSSTAAFLPGPLMAIYYATKTYILSFSAALANECKGTGVTITVFCPGQTNTRFQSSVASLSNSIESRRIGRADPVKAARHGYLAMKAGKSLAVPGVRNKLFAQFHRIMPAKMTCFLIRLLQEYLRRQPEKQMK